MYTLTLQSYERHKRADVITAIRDWCNTGIVAAWAILRRFDDGETPHVIQSTTYDTESVRKFKEVFTPLGTLQIEKAQDPGEKAGIAYLMSIGCTPRQASALIKAEDPLKVFYDEVTATDGRVDFELFQNLVSYFGTCS